MVAQQLAGMPEAIHQALAGCLRSFRMPILPYTLVVGMKMPDPEQLMTLEQLRKACSDAPRGVPLLVAEAIWRRDLVQKIGHQSYPSWFEAALKRHGAQLHRELYLREDPSQPIEPMRMGWRGTYRGGKSVFSNDWQDELLKQQIAMRADNNR